MDQPIVIDNRAGGGGVVGRGDREGAARSPGLTLGITGASALVAAPPAVAHAVRRARGFANLTPVVRVRQCGQRRLRPRLACRPGARCEVADPPPALRVLGRHLGAGYCAAGAGGGHRTDRRRGAAPALTDLLAQRVAGTIVDLPVALGQVRSGDLKAIAITSASRAPQAPDVPTASEQGLPGLATDNWYGLAPGPRRN